MMYMHQYAMPLYVKWYNEKYVRMRWDEPESERRHVMTGASGLLDIFCFSIMLLHQGKSEDMHQELKKVIDAYRILVPLIIAGVLLLVMGAFLRM